MKAYIGNVDWADEGNVFFFSIEDEERLQTMKELLKVLRDTDLIPQEVEMYWGTNEFFQFDTDDLIKFIDTAEDISEEELEVFNKFGVYGFDIYDRILTFIYEDSAPWGDILEIGKEELSKIEPLFIKLFGQKSWDDIKETFIVKD